MVKTKCEVFTRTVGYLRPIDMMSDSKQAEVRDRLKFDNFFGEKQTKLK